MSETSRKWLFAVNVSDLGNGDVRKISLNGTDVLICRYNNDFYAIENLCSHMDQPLENGKLNGCVLTCPFHGARFNIANGEALSGPTRAPLSTFELRITNRKIFIRMPMKRVVYSLFPTLPTSDD